MSGFQPGTNKKRSKGISLLSTFFNHGGWFRFRLTLSQGVTPIPQSSGFSRRRFSITDTLLGTGHANQLRNCDSQGVTHSLSLLYGNCSVFRRPHPSWKCCTLFNEKEAILNFLPRLGCQIIQSDGLRNSLIRRIDESH